MGTDNRAFAGEQPEVTRPEVTSVTWPEVALTGSDVSIQKYLLRMRNRKLCNIRLFWPELTSVTWPEEACPEVLVCACATGSCATDFPRFFLTLGLCSGETLELTRPTRVTPGHTRFLLYWRNL